MKDNPPRLAARHSGFTLVELVVVIAITGIIAASLVVFFRPAVDSYVATRRRAELTDIADSALRRIARDLRSAVPNSIRQPNSQCFEFVPSSSGGRYRLAPDSAAPTAYYMDGNSLADAFDLLSPLSSTPAVGDWVVINNQYSGDIYAGVNRAAIKAPLPDTSSGHGRITLSTSLDPHGYAGGRFVVVPNAQQAVFYTCESGTLYRIVSSFAAPNTCPSTVGATGVLARQVRRCNFDYSPSDGATQQGLIWMQVELGDENESVTLSFGVHVDNVP